MAPSFSLGATTLTSTTPNKDATTIRALENENPFSNNDENNMMNLLEPAQSSSSVHLEEMTFIFLSPVQQHPPGTLSWDVLDTSYSVMNAWSKTSTQIWAETAYAIFKRLLEEENATNKQLVFPKHYGMVVGAYAKADNPRAAAEEFLQENLHGPSPANRVLLNSILTAYYDARRGNTEQATRVFEQIRSPRH